MDPPCRAGRAAAGGGGAAASAASATVTAVDTEHRHHPCAYSTSIHTLFPTGARTRLRVEMPAAAAATG
jgi:hypothetical protein